ncbi:MAG TPA: DUF2330 domain-containing protein [Kofleriaceae bacterium]|nr:DUF2330 domain-containing protein [Kofleriaceae bacterium]
MRRITLAATLAATVALGASQTAHAFCGFYVGGGDQKMFNDATQVVLMRMGTRTVLSMQNNYKGPPEAFAMVVPVPTVLQEADVKTLNREVFEHVEQMGAPRLVEYWEQDPCGSDEYDRRRYAPAKGAAAPTTTLADEKAKDYGVTIEAKFVVGEYQIVILSAKDSTGLDSWLRAEKYKIPDGAEPLLRPYVESGMKFFVAKVDPAKVKWVGDGNDKHAELSPLRFHYDSDEFALPIRLGMANSSGTQDLIVNILAPQRRYEVTNYKNVMIPTNIDVSPQMRDQFAAFYTALFDKTVEKNPGAVVTEYAWQATTCDPCPGPALSYPEFQTLGADVLDGTRDKPVAYNRGDFVLTRLHARYGKTLTDDLRFREAEAIAGGREHMTSNGKLEEGWEKASINNFQGRYAIRHPWTGPLTCKDPKRGRWGGPPAEITAKPDFVPSGVKPAVDLAYAPRGTVELPKVVKRDIPELGIRAAAGAAVATPNVGTTPSTPASTPGKTEDKKTGCGCETGGEPGTLALVGLAAAAFAWRRRQGGHQG